MRLAVYNVENLFDRPKAMNLGTWDEGKAILQDFAVLSELLGELDYTTARKQSMSELMNRLGLEKQGVADYTDKEAKKLYPQDFERLKKWRKT